MSAEDIEIEAVPGLPDDLPPGEHIVWQGRPEWKALAQQTFKLRWLVLYFAIFATVRLVVAIHDHQGASGAIHLGLAILLASACIGVLCLMSWLSARATIYTITSRRIVMRIGLALPMTWNLPFKRLASADLKVRKEGDGDIVLGLTAPNRIAWLHLWPHNRPLHFAKAQPALRAISEPARVSKLLANAVEAWAAANASPVLVAGLEGSENREEPAAIETGVEQSWGAVASTGSST